MTTIVGLLAILLGLPTAMIAIKHRTVRRTPHPPLRFGLPVHHGQVDFAGRDYEDPHPI